MDPNLFHQLQYDRIDKLETKRENFSNYVLTISSGIFILSISILDKYNPILILGIFMFGFSINIIAILFIKSTMPFITMHKERAKKIREKYNIDFSNIINSVVKPKPEIELFKKNYSFKRHDIYILLHWIIIIFFALITIYSCIAEIEKIKPLLIQMVE